jgi:mannosyltransferase OCH1-like enzyme
MKLRNGVYEDFKQFISNRRVFAFGASKLLTDFVYNNTSLEFEENIFKIVDNDKNKVGKNIVLGIKNLEIISLDQLKNVFSEKDVLIITTCYYAQIVEQLSAIREFDNVDCFILEYVLDTYKEMKDVAYFFNKHKNKENLIPKKIHYCWFGNSEIPDKEKRCIESWYKMCPDYEIIRWDESNYDITKNRYMLDAYRQKKWGFVPDYARLDIIYENGGIYLDTDVEIIKPLDSLLHFEGFAGFESKDYIAFGLGFGAIKGNDIVKYLLDDYINLTFIDSKGNMNLKASPVLQTEALQKLGFCRNNSLQEINGFVFLPNEFLCGLSFLSGLPRVTENTFTIHHYSASWITNKAKLEKMEQTKFRDKYNSQIIPI